MSKMKSSSQSVFIRCSPRVESMGASCDASSVRAAVRRRHAVAERRARRRNIFSSVLAGCFGWPRSLVREATCHGYRTTWNEIQESSFHPNVWNMSRAPTSLCERCRPKCRSHVQEVCEEAVSERGLHHASVCALIGRGAHLLQTWRWLHECLSET